MTSVLEIIQLTSAFFQKKGVESPRLNVEHLLAHVLGKRRMDLYLEFDRPLGEQVLEPLRDLVRRRAAGEPLQHLLGTVEFLGRVFRTDKRALIPRPETEQLCEILLTRQPAPRRVLEVGVGSGVIACSLALAWPEAEVSACDISPDALALAAENAASHGLTERVKFFQSDLLAGVDGLHDLIVANLPYIPAGDIPGLSREVQHDPHLALDGGPDGLQLIRRLATDATAKLDGLLALEIGTGQGPAVAQILADAGYTDVQILPDYNQHTRFALAQHRLAHG